MLTGRLPRTVPSRGASEGRRTLRMFEMQTPIGEESKSRHLGVAKNLHRAFQTVRIPPIQSTFDAAHFSFRLQQTHYIKNETLIRYPISNVDFSRWSQIPSRSRYSLISVVNHFGSMNSGHYTSYCNDGQQWYYCDDQSMRPADQRELERNVHAYLLVYSSISQPPLTLPPISN